MIWHNAELRRLELRLQRAEETLERVVDNALSAHGLQPLFHPEDERFQPRPPDPDAAESFPPPRTPRELLTHLEALDLQRSQRESRQRLQRELKQIAQERQ